MRRPTFILLSAILWPVLTAGHVHAQANQPSPAEAKLRDSLRSTMLQLRSAENDKATLQAQVSDAEAKATDLQGKVDAMIKQMAVDKTAADTALTEAKAKSDERDKIIAGLRDQLFKTQTEDKQNAELAAVKEAQRAKLEGQNVQLNRRVSDQQVKNEGMYKIANEILARYEKFGLGDALTAREPFTGITRVKLQSLFEEYRDKLTDTKIKPQDAPAPEPKATPTPDKNAKPKPAPSRTSDQTKQRS